MKEIWKPIKNYEGIYEVSNLGNVKRLTYSMKINPRSYTQCVHYNEHLLKPRPHRAGYQLVVLSKNGKATGYSVHKLVAEAFIPNPDNLSEINHKDEDKANNRVDNLEWCTRIYNNTYGTMQQRKAEKLRKSVLCIETNIIYPSVREAAKQTGADRSSISACCKGKQKTTKGYHWKYS